MDREEADAGRFVEDFLGTVAVMDVEVDDQDSVQIEPASASSAAIATLP